MCTTCLRRSRRRRRIRLSSLALGGLLGSGQLFAVDTSWVGPAAGSWSTAANWSGAAVPNNGVPAATRYNVFIDAGNAQNTAVTLNISATMDNLTITSADQLSVNNAINLTLVGNDVT